MAAFFIYGKNYKLTELKSQIDWKIKHTWNIAVYTSLGFEPLRGQTIDTRASQKSFPKNGHVEVQWQISSKISQIFENNSH